MAMISKVEELAPLLHPDSRLRRGLALLEDCQAGRLPEVLSLVATLPPGETRRVSLEGDALYLLLQCYQPKRRSEGRFEAHERHTDLQFLWSGREIIEVCDLHNAMPSVSYDARGNVYFPMRDEVHHRFLLQAGDVAVLLPRDAHAACLKPQGTGEELVRKIVVKVEDAHLKHATGEVPALKAGAISVASVAIAAPASAGRQSNLLRIP